MRILYTLAFAGILVSEADAQLSGPAMWADSARRLIETAYIGGDVEGLVRTRALIERALTRYPDDALLLHYQGYAFYREANLRRGTGQGDVNDLLDSAEDALQRSMNNLEMAETQALLSSVIGQKIGSNPIKGMMLGPRSDEWMQRAMSSAPNNPRVWLLRGMGAIFKPEMFGGGLDRASADLNRAIELFASDRPEAGMPAWGHGEAWVWLGQVHQRAGRKDDARIAYRKALELEPSNAWVKGVLLPGLDAKEP